MAFGVSPPTPLCSPATLMAQGKAGKPSQKRLWPREPLSPSLTRHSQAKCSCWASGPATEQKSIYFQSPLSGSEPESMLNAPCLLGKGAPPESVLSAGSAMLVKVGGNSSHWEEARARTQVPHLERRSCSLESGWTAKLWLRPGIWDTTNPANRVSVQQTNQHSLQPRADNSIEVWKNKQKQNISVLRTLDHSCPCSSVIKAEAWLCSIKIGNVHYQTLSPLLSPSAGRDEGLSSCVNYIEATGVSLD